MSNATIVSVCNFSIGPEFKPGLFPNDYVIPAATEDKLGLAVIGDGYVDVPQLDRKSIRMIVIAAEIARSIVEDWKIAQLQIGPGAQPGLFYVDGAHSEDTILDTCEDKLEKARNEHTEWANRLVKMGDDLWQLKPSHRQISRTMISAAIYLHVDRVWTKSSKPTDTVICPACTSRVPTGAAVCLQCKVILDPEKYAQFEFARG